MNIMAISMMLIMLVTAITACLITFLVMGLAKVAGWHLRRISRSRRQMILAQVKTEQKAYSLSKGKPSPKSDDEDWEKVESQISQERVSGVMGDDKWSGIIGFFHPFW